MSKPDYPAILSFAAYLIELVLVFFPQVPIFISGLPTSQRIALLCAMFVLPALPFLVGKRQGVYSFLCRIFRVSEDERTLLGIIWSNPRKEWTVEEICKRTGLDAKRTQNLLRRLASRGLLTDEKNHAKEKS